MSKFKLSKLIVRSLIAVATLAGLATITWAQRYDLPAHEDILVKINTPRHERLNPNQINILVWNMQKGIQNSWADDYQLLSKGKDILFLQEVLLDDNMGDVLEKHDDYSYHVAASFKDTWDDHAITGVATASIADPIASSYLRSYHREPVIATPKMAMIAAYSLAGMDKTLLTANIHAINFVSEEKHRYMLSELETLLTGHDGPMILAGDFNTWTEEKTNTLKQMVQRLGLSEVSFSDDDRTRIFGNALDWVFAKGLSVAFAQVHGSITGSDHSPMEVAFSVQTDLLSVR
jgi:endonuclease/exonuclease/phosphatase (EEP) superfamily protein YafD